MALLTPEESFSLPLDRANGLYGAHINPQLLKIHRALGLAAMDVESAEGVEIRLAGGRTILDFSAGMGIPGLGHNHPRIIAAERVCHETMAIDALKMAPLRL